MQKTDSILIDGSKEKPIAIDIHYKDDPAPKPVVIFCHGFKGFKNWGHFDLVAKAFTENDFVFVKFNFSYNGTTPGQPLDFADLEAFGENNYTTELDDLGLVIDHIQQHADKYNGDASSIYLIGHSRGGGIAIVKAHEDSRIKKLCTWASVKNMEDFIGGMDIGQWKREGFIYTFNSRTQQNMPLGYQLYEDFLQHKDRLDIPAAAKALHIPWLIVHGTNDSSVPYESAEQLHEWNHGSELLLLREADHTFGGKHPWDRNDLPEAARIAVVKTIGFFRNGS